MGTPGRQRQAELAARKREAGLGQVTVWVPLDRRTELIELARRWCDPSAVTDYPPWLPEDLAAMLPGQLPIQVAAGTETPLSAVTMIAADPVETEAEQRAWKMARSFGRRAICRETGLSEWKVRKIMAAART